MPSYDVLVNIWKLGHSLGIEGLCERTLEAMAECKRLTRAIPDTPLLVQVWKDTPAGSSIRQLLLSWAAEYLRSSHERSEFARSLPQELLSELVVAMSSYGDGFLAASGAAKAAVAGGREGGSGKKNIHYLDGNDNNTAAAAAAVAAAAVAAVGGSYRNGDRDPSPASKRARYTDTYPQPAPTTTGAGTSPAPSSAPPAAGKKQGRTSLPTQRIITKKRNIVDADSFSSSQKLKFCSDLITRMLSGPGTLIVHAFFFITQLTLTRILDAAGRPLP